MTEPHDPAMPALCSLKDDGSLTGAQTGNTTGWMIGLTKREHFAALAMQGLMASPFYEKILVGSPDEVFAVQAVTKSCVEMADALIAELNK